MDDALAADLLVKSRHLTYFRLAFASITLIFALFVQHFAAQELDPVGLVASGFAVLSCNLLALNVFISKNAMPRRVLKFMNAFLVAVDIGALSYVVHFTQGVQSDLFFLYLLPILLASNVFEKFGTYLTALVASMAYLATVLAENSSFIPYLMGNTAAASGSGLTTAYAQRLWLQVASRSATLFIVSMIWAAFCQRMSSVVQHGASRLSDQLKANTLLIVELQAQAKREHLSNSISLALRRTLDLNSILSTTCSALGEVLGSSRCLLVTRAGSQNGEPVLWESAPPEDGRDRPAVPASLQKYFVEHSWQRKPDDVPFNKIIQSEVPFEDEAELAPIKDTLVQLGVCGILLRPIMYGTNLKGVLAIISEGTARRFFPSELEMIESVAGQVAVAIEHAELVSKLSETNKDLLQKNQNLDAKNLEMKQMQSQLIHQEKMASLGRIVAGIAHELNNPINFVHGNLPYLKEYFEEMKSLIACFDELPEEHQELARAAKKKINYEFVITDLDNIIADLVEGTDRIRQIIRNLRSFSRLDEAELKEASIEEGIESTLKLLNQYYGRDKVQVELQFCGLPAVTCYPGKLNQVWMNLLSNAAQALGNRADGLVRISTNLDGEHFLVTIEDNGPGIKSGDQSKIFEPFFTTKAVGQGTGLGLSISHSIVERHGGHIWFESTPGKGTKFLVRIPLVAPAPEGQELEELAISESTAKQ